MASTLAELLVRLGVDSADFNEKLKDAQKKSESFGKNVSSSLESAAKKFGALALAAGAAGVVIVKHAIEAADRLGELAQQTGLTTDQLQALGNIAAKSGSSLDDIADSASKFNKAISEGAGSGTDKLNDQALAFKLLGVSIADLKTKNTGQILEEVAQKLSTFEDDANKVRLEQELFGKSGAALAGTLNALGKDGLDPTIERLRTMGVLISKDTIKAADKFNDKLVDAGALVTAFKTRIAVALLPTLEDLVTHFTDAANEGDGFKDAAEGIANGLKGIAVVAIVIKSALVGLGGVLGGLAGKFSILYGDAFKSPLAGAGPLGFSAALAASYIKNRKILSEADQAGSDDITAKVSADFETIARLLRDGAKKIDAAGEEVGKKKIKAPSITDAKEAAAAYAAALKQAFAKAEAETKGALALLKETLREREAVIADAFANDPTQIKQYYQARIDAASEGSAAEIAQIQQEVNEVTRIRAQAGLDKNEKASLSIKLIDLEQARLLAVAKQENEALDLRREETKALRDQRLALEEIARAMEQQRGFAGIELGKIGADQDLALHRTNLQEKLRLDREYSDARFALEIKGLQAALVREGKTEQERAQLRSQIESAEQDHQKALTQIDNSAELERMKYVLEARDALQGDTANLFSDLISGAKSAKDAFRDFANSVINDIGRILARKLAEQLFDSGGGYGSLIASAADALFGGGFSSTGVHTTANIPERSVGGTVKSGSAYLVGENGPEMFVPNVSGAIVPNNNMMGASFIQNFTVMAPEGRLSPQTDLQLRSAAGMAVRFAMSRNG